MLPVCPDAKLSSALASLKASIGLVDHINAALAAHNAVVAVTLGQ